MIRIPVPNAVSNYRVSVLESEISSHVPILLANILKMNKTGRQI